MKLKFALLNLFLGCISLLTINTKFTSYVIAEELPKVELNAEIKKGKFLIGLKQYLGGENDSFSKKKNINFITDKGFLKLIFFFLEKLSFSPPRYCFKPIKNFPFFISVLSSTLSNSSAFA